ncbi:MAG TPA: branched-chain amino acid ABC transporter permease, partial [Bradyrhizobium sp.]|uniref:branched-chain amino acid ABC transporter permease n=1 Tax=Bradyrhizobium sp. TaxID=376 RepID=UPI002B7F8827
MSRRRFREGWVWVVALVVAIAAPWVFFNYSTGRHSGFVLSMLSQMGMMSILALSYNMLLGQAGLFSLCHATFFGIGGYATIHFLDLAGAGSLPLPMEFIPLLAGLSGLGLAIVFGYMATKQRATAFAMITLGIGELMVTAALMFHHFFGGEGGVNANRMIGHSLFALKYASGIQVYYLILAWTLIAALAMFFLTLTPLGRMANATRDNFERAQFMGYDPRIVRFLQFALAGFFAGIGGGLYAITYEIVTFDALAAPLSANALLMAYIGGSASFGGPIIGAVLITLLQSGVSLMSNSWLIYVGVLFI